MSVSADSLTPVDYFHEELFDTELADQILDSTIDELPEARVLSNSRPLKEAPSYLALLWRRPLLSSKQEACLFRQLNYLKYCRAMQGSALPDELTDRLGDIRDCIIESNTRLVVSIAKKYAPWQSERFDDLVGVGNAALVRAVDRFDYRRQVRFSTYAYQAIQRAMVDLFRHESRYSSKITTEDQDAIASVSSDAGASLAAQRDASEAKHDVTGWLDQLDDRDRRIVMTRFGLGRREDRVAFHVIAKEVGLSTTRVVQLFRRSMDRLQALARRDSNRVTKWSVAN